MTARTRRRPSTTTMLLRGLVRRCPLCGSGGCFVSWFTLEERCPRCNLSLDRVEGHWIGALGMNTIASGGALLVVLVGGFAATWPESPSIWLLVACVAVSVGVPLLFYGSSRTLWSAVDLAMRPLEPDDEVDPRWIPRPRTG
ncbi:MAG: hypothetical protein AB7L84_00930 [Acidimicrobiia bacterium]